MQKHLNTRNIANRQQDSIEGLREIHPLPRFALGLFTSAFLAWFGVSLISSTLTGVPLIPLAMWHAHIIGIGVLMLLNFIGHALKRILLVGAVCAALMACYEVSFVVRVFSLQQWQAWLTQLVVPSAVLLLNAYLFVRYQRAAGLKVDGGR